MGGCDPQQDVIGKSGVGRSGVNHGGERRSAGSARPLRKRSGWLSAGGCHVAENGAAQQHKRNDAEDACQHPCDDENEQHSAVECALRLRHAPNP